MCKNVFYDEIEHCDLKRFVPSNLGFENLKGTNDDTWSSASEKERNNYDNKRIL